ncbi:hypothetical protein DEO72_LG9g599 [Vigna unguiculata]|uniref:Uncharacterized protein n=1 Tax=Vigna unguiculata TaxID=3917 RepID=A0A4D6N0G1_VIGUN|nr:hypothetical protein DEO72_LG9g599 [Vigna unguiculata]
MKLVVNLVVVPAMNALCSDGIQPNFNIFSVAPLGFSESGERDASFSCPPNEGTRFNPLYLSLLESDPMHVDGYFVVGGYTHPPHCPYFYGD